MATTIIMTISSTRLTAPAIRPYSSFLFASNGLPEWGGVLLGCDAFIFMVFVGEVIAGWLWLGVG